MALGVAVIASVLVAAGAPVVGQARAALQAVFPGQYRLILGSLVAAAALAAVGAALVRIRTRRAYRYGLLGIALGVAVVFDIASLTGNPDVDAVERFHFVEYGAVAWLYFLVWREHDDLSVVVLPMCGGALTGLADEAVQWFVPGRVGELRDVILNGVALVCGLLVALAVDGRVRHWRPPSLRTRLTIGATLGTVLLGLTAFVHVVHLGHVVDDGTSRFMSTFTRDGLLGASNDRRLRWSSEPPTTLRRFGREDRYLEEALWHVQRRNGARAANDFDSAWRENLLLETYFEPALTFPSYGGRTRWLDEERQAVRERVLDDRALFSSRAHAIPIFTIAPWVLWTTTLASVAALWGVCLRAGRRV